MDPLDALYINAKTFPRNFNDRTLPPCALDAITSRLDEHASRLFLDEGRDSRKILLHFLQLDNDAEDFWPTNVKSSARLRQHLKLPYNRNLIRPQCTFLFVQAPHSRDKLQTTRDMLMLCFTHFMVMPEFLDFLLPFGYQTYKEDFFHSGFRQKSQISPRHHPQDSPCPSVTEGRFEMCYALKSPEQSIPDGWSIRHCAIYHSFNIKTVQAVWIMVKGNEVIRKRVESATSSRGVREMTSHETIDKAFSASLTVHLLVVDWSVETWRWYINSLEDRTQRLTRRALSGPVRPPSSPKPISEPHTTSRRVDTAKSDRIASSVFSRTQTGFSEKGIPPMSRQRQVTPLQTILNKETGVSQPVPPDEQFEELDEPVDMAKNEEDETRSDFNIEKLRKVQRIEEDVHQALLILRQNITVLEQLRTHYQSLNRYGNFPNEIVSPCQENINRFQCHVQGAEKEMQIQILRLEYLLQLLADRQTLLRTILDFQNTEANKFANKSMVAMTEEMSEIASQTKIETVSMRVITLVTLFFLPGTFISTLMSTQIFESSSSGEPNPNPYKHLVPLNMYLALSLPLTLLTLVIWGAFHFWETRRENRKKVRQIKEFWEA